MTLEQLTALSDPELSVLAARKIHGWQVSYGTWEERGSFIRCHLYESPEGAVMPVDDYRPAMDRNQSGELMAVMAERGVCFFISVGVDEPSIQWMVGTDADDQFPRFDGTVPGNIARSETLAALMAAFAMEDKPHA